MVKRTIAWWGEKKEKIERASRSNKQPKARSWLKLGLLERLTTHVDTRKGGMRTALGSVPC